MAVSGVKDTHQLHRRRIHAAEHLKQHRDICRIQGSFGQHGAQRLTRSRVGCCRTKCKRYLTGIVTSVTQITRLLISFIDYYLNTQPVYFLTLS